MPYNGFLNEPNNNLYPPTAPTQPQAARRNLRFLRCQEPVRKLGVLGLDRQSLLKGTVCWFQYMIHGTGIFIYLHCYIYTNTPDVMVNVGK